MHDESISSNKALQDFLFSINNKRGLASGRSKIFKELNVEINEIIDALANTTSKYSYSSDITIKSDINSGYYILEIENSTLSGLLKKQSFWPSQHLFSFINNSLHFKIDNKNIKISIR